LSGFAASPRTVSPVTKASSDRRRTASGSTSSGSGRPLSALRRLLSMTSC
jgi:hypothetical protein